jgi:hypothetical protein
MNIYARAAAFARSNMGQGTPTVQDARLMKDARSVDDAIRTHCADLMEGGETGDVWNLFEEEADGWMAQLRDLSEKQIRASWPDMAALFEEAGV